MNARTVWIGCTGHSDITEIMLKMELNTIQSINQTDKVQVSAFNPLPDDKF